MKTKKIAALLAALAGLALAQAQTIHRCGSTYSQQPCEGAVAVSTVDTRISRAGEASSFARRDAKLADEMERARLKEEAKPARVVIMPGRPVVAEEKNTTAKPAKVAHFTAVGPKPAGEDKKKKKKKPA